MGFICTGCGSCCKRVDKGVLVTRHIPELHFPYTWDESGRCEMLQQDNTCKVYENRPLICNIERFAEHFKVEKDAFYSENYQACKEMQEEDNVEEKYRTKL